MAKKKTHPPLIQQFIDNQKRYPDAIVATEVGGFFEIWEVHDENEKVGHAIRVTQLLDTVLTKRNKSDPDSPYMTGFPSHSAEGYFKKLVDLGETVVIVEQHIRGRKADGNKNVTREITKILSPGTVIEQLNEAQNNFFASVYHEDKNFLGISLIDVSTGEVKITEMSSSEGQDYLDKIKPREILITGDIKLNFHEKQLIHYNSESNKISKLNSAGKLLAELYDVKNPTSNPTYSVTALGLEYYRLGVLSLGNVLNYLAATEYNSKLLKKLGKPEIYSVNKHLTIPLNGYLSLEVFSGTNEKHEENSLINALDNCKTAMGRRKLKSFLLTPLANKEEISLRHDKVEKLIEKKNFYPELKDVYDIARLSRRMIFGRLMPHEIAQFYQSLSIGESIITGENKELGKTCKKITKLISSNVDVPTAAVYTDSQDFNFFQGKLKESVKKEYDHWKNSEEEMLTYKDSLEKKLGTSRLRMSEKSESFFLHAPKGIAEDAAQQGIKIQIKANDAQIVDEKWTELSLKCFGHKQQYRQLCEKEWIKFQSEIIQLYGSEIIEISELVGELDVLSNFAQISYERGYHRPELLDNATATLKFKNLRHPVVEKSKKLMEPFVSNDVILGDEYKTLVIYGANSAGKSTILKSVALNILMAQVGCFIAADKGSSMTVMDSILTRMTSFDSLSEGLSTFTMEMTELQVALSYVKKKAVFLFDEIGRGTSVEDGEAIAYATLTYLDNEENKCVTLFATHYHSLYDRIKNLKPILVKNVHCYTDHLGRLVFARKLQEGPGNGSYGIEVAKSCGLPEELIRSAARYSEHHAPIKKSRYNSNVQGSLCPVCEENPVQQTHHIHEQKQGTIKEFIVDGSKKSINHQSNLLMICATCHEKITRGEITVEKRKVLGSNQEVEVEVKHVRKS